MRPLLPLLLLIMGGCGADCLPEPDADPTPPSAHLTVTYTDAATRQPAVHTIASGDTTATVRAAADAPIDVVYAGADEEGLRGIVIAATYQLAVGIGVHRESRMIPPVTSSCPRAELSGKARFPGTGERRNLVLSAAAENWTGRRSVTPNLIVELMPPSAP